MQEKHKFGHPSLDLRWKPSDEEIKIIDRFLREATTLIHQAWVSYQLGCDQPFNVFPTPAQLDSQLNALKEFLKNPMMTVEESHENWVQYKFSLGWKFGPVKDEDKKEHPDLVPFEELPKVEREKDVMDLLARRIVLSTLLTVYKKGHADCRSQVMDRLFPQPLIMLKEKNSS